jgi:amino acid permease
MFSFEGNGVVINLKAEARDKKRYPSLLKAAMITIIIWYMILASMSYLTFKGTAKDYVTSNLDISGFTILIDVLFCINAITSYPLQILCAFEIIEDFAFFKQ